jgi:hypothetical protein
MHISEIFCDLAKAFDCMNHEVLLTVLYFYGIWGVFEDWFRSYLTNRRQKVEVAQNILSDWSALEHGVPQGSVLGPLLYIICQWHLENKPCIRTKLFADDTSVIISSRNFKDFCSVSN